MAKQIYGIAPTNVVLRFKLLNSSVTTGAGLSGLTSATSGLTISTIQNVQGANGESSPVTYTTAGSTIESITTLGTYAAPTATKCRFKEVNPTYHPGIYELQLADARFSSGINPLTLLVSVNGATNLAQADFEIECKNQDSNIMQIGGSTIALINLSANYAQSASPTQVPSFAQFIGDSIDYQKGHHTVAGKTYYVDGIGGNDTTGDGSRVRPYKLISKALTSVVSNQHDQIILLPNQTGNPTIITEPATINIGKSYVQIRGVGRDVVVTNTSNTSVFNISANGVGIQGMRISTAGGATSNGITVTSGDFNRFERIWIENSHQDAINLTLANRTEIVACNIVSATRDGIRINDGVNLGYNNQIIENIIRGCIGIGINVLGAGASYSRIQKNIIRDNASGIFIATGTLNTVISDNRIAGNIINYTNNGTLTYEQWDWLNTDQNGSTITNSVSTGAAINQNASSWLNLSTPVATTETGGVQNIVGRDGVYDILTNVSQSQDSYYQFNIGGTGIPTGLTIYAALQNNTRTMAVYGYNWISSSWIQIGSIIGTAALTFVLTSMAMFTSMVGTGINAGNVRIRFLSNIAGATFTIDQLYVQYTVTTNSVGYLDGAIWINSISGTAGTVPYINGTADNPVLTYADALSIATSLNINRFHIAPDTDIVLTRNHDYWTFIGTGNIDLNGQSINDTIFIDCENIVGISTGKDSRFTDCNIGTCTLDSCLMDDCNFNGVMTTVTSGEYTIRGGIDAIPGIFNPTIVCKPYANYGLRNWRGGININQMNSTNNFYIDGQGRVVIDSTVSGGNLSVRGNFDMLDNVSGGFTSIGILVDTARYNEDQNIRNVVGNISGSVNNIIVPVVIGTNLDKTNYTVSSGTITSITNNVTVGTNLDKTNYTVSSGTITSITNTISANVIQINSNTSAATNLELQFNGSGILGNSFPARQDQLTNLAAVGAATNEVSDTFILTSGTVITGTYVTTFPRDGIYHQLADSSGNLDVYYEFDIGGRGVPTSVFIYGGMTGNNDSSKVYGWNWSTSAWVQVGTIVGLTNLTPAANSYPLYTNMVGTGINLGKVRVRFANTALTTSNLYIDQLYISYSTVSNSIGYLNGAIWIDTTGGTAGTTLYINGTADKPVNNLSDAIILANALGVRTFRFSPESDIILTQAFDNWIFEGKAVINFNGQSINDSIFVGFSNIIGICSGTNIEFRDCSIDTITVDSSHFHDCRLNGTITTRTSATYTFMSCVDEMPAGYDAPTIIFSPYTIVGLRNYRGGMNVNNMTTNSELKMDGAGRLNIMSNCSGGEITMRGFINYSDMVIGGFQGIITDSARFAEDQSLANITGNISGSVNNIVSNVTVGTNLDKINYSISGGIITTILDKSDYTLTTSEHNLIQSDASIGILSTSANKLKTDTLGYVTVNNVTGNVSGSVNNIVSNVTVGTNLDKTSYSISGTKKTLDVLNDITTAQVNTQVASALVSYDSNGGVAKENSLLSIQNNTNFVATIASIMLIPISGFNVYKTQVLYYSTSGTLMNVDDSEMAVYVETSTAINQTIHLYKDAACISACSASTTWPTYRRLVNTAIGTYEGYYQVSASEDVGQLLWQFNMKVGGQTISYSRTNVLYSEIPGTTILANNDTNKTIIAESILLTAANKIKTNISNQVESSSVQGNITGSVNSVVVPVAISGSNIITQQQVRDAMSLSATITTILGSVDNYLTTINTNTSAITFTGSNINAQVKAQDNIDFGILQKTSLNASTPISVGTITGNVNGSVGSVLGSVTVGTNNDKTNYTVISGIINSITGNIGGNIVGNINGNVVGNVGSVVGNIGGSVNSVLTTVSADIVEIAGITSAATALSQYTNYSIGEAPVGTNLVTVITTTSAARVPNVNVSIYNTSNQVIRSLVTGSNGDSSLRIDNGSYIFACNKANSNFADLSATISGDTTITLSGSYLSPTIPSMGLQTVYGFVIHGDASIANNAQIVASLESVGIPENNYQITTKQIITTSDNTGYFELQLVKSATFKISETWGGRSYFVKNITVTSDNIKDITTY